MGITGPAFEAIEIDGNRSLSISKEKFGESLLDVLLVAGIRYIKRIEQKEKRFRLLY